MSTATSSDAPWDVIIVGGRPAGASLAARLGARGMRVLVLERATFPSPPAVPSSPSLHPAAMRLLDEIGIDEARYADEHSRMRTLTMQFHTYFTARLTVPTMFGRDFFAGADRARFDQVLWDNLARFPSVVRREGFGVTELLRGADGRVAGVVGAARNGEPESLRARAVVGADGRFSLVARRAGAEITEERTEHLSTVYYADWEGVAPVAPGVAGAHIYATGRGLDVLLLAVPGGRISINTHERADRVLIEGDPQGYYLRTLNALPGVARRLEHARQVTPIAGIKRIGNGYRRASGPGWVLVGDALHFKDPVDGQGIYDALLAARLLDAALAAWHSGAPWERAMADYARGVHDATHGMFLATCDRLKRELYEEPPVPVIRTLLRWMLTDPGYQARFLRFLARDLPAEGWMNGAVLAGAVARGIGRDVRGILPGARA